MGEFEIEGEMNGWGTPSMNFEMSILTLFGQLLVEGSVFTNIISGES